MRVKIRVNIGRLMLTYMPNAHVILGKRLHCTWGSMAIPGIGVFTYLKRTKATDRRYSFQVIPYRVPSR